MTPPAADPLAPLTSAAARASHRHVDPILERLREAGHAAVLVGGAVRDLLLGREPGDWDVATDAVPDRILELWPEAALTGRRFGTVTVATGREPVEVTPFRTEGPYADGRHPDWVRFDADLDGDLARRDFTVNALAWDPLARLLHDPQDGRADLDARILRAVGDPDRRFAEDGLRPMRGIRLATVLGFTIAPDTLAAIARARETVAGVAVERLRDELMKLLAAERPSTGVELLRETGLLELVLPELLESVGVEQNRFHAYDVYRHSLHVLDATPPDRPLVRLAGLLHDVGKPRTRRVVEGEGTFYGHERVGATMTRDMLDRLRFSHPERDRVTRLVAEHMFHYTPEWSDAAVRRFLRRVGPDLVDDLFELRLADLAGKGTGPVETGDLEELGGRIEAVTRREDALRIGDLDIDGRTVMEHLGLGPGPEVGQVLGRLLEAVIENPELNRRETLLALLETARPIDEGSADS